MSKFLDSIHAGSQAPSEINRQLKLFKERVRRLEESNRRNMNAFDLVASMGELQGSSVFELNPSSILAITRRHLQLFIKLKAAAFMIHNEGDNGFKIADCEPSTALQFFTDEIRRYRAEGSFADASKKNRAIIVPGKNPPQQVILHVVATPERILGMFLGVLENSTAQITDSTRSLLSILLRMTANALDNAGLYRKIKEHNRNLKALVQDRTKQLEGLLPICSYCKKIKDDEHKWQQMESYISRRTKADFSHGICPDCYDKHMVPQLRKLRNAKKRA